MSPAIVVVTYNRPNSLLRLLNSLSASIFEGQNVPLVISIDFQNSEKHNEVVEISKSFEWLYGEKQIIEYNENLGLRNHILKCGELTSRFKSIVLLEDDILVSPFFYNYVNQALSFYSNSNEIGGISLYNHCLNVNCNRPFQASCEGADAYLMQFAQSWGQCWTAEMWNDFYLWYQDNTVLHKTDYIPEFVFNWPSSSWLKFFIKYLVDNNKYFVYPAVSLSTNFSDAGTHIKRNSAIFQVPLETGHRKYTFKSFDQSVKYDVFFERVQVEFPDCNADETCIDIYGTKPDNRNKRYWLTNRCLEFKILGTYGLLMRPHELNIIFNIEGNDIFLYDTFQRANKISNLKKSKSVELLYDIRAISIKDLLRVLITKIRNKF